MRAKKSLGQNFLKSEKALNNIVRAGELTSKDTVLEIGPGTGNLTQKLLETNAQIVAVEKDDNLFLLLKQRYKKEISVKRLTLIHDDILNFKPTKFDLKKNNYKLIANIPYNLTGIIIRKFLETEAQPEKLVLLVQKEVAERIVARNGKESILSISVKVYGTPRYVETVKAGSFAPMPKVDSAILEINTISKAFFSNMGCVDTECQQLEGGFFEMVRAGFKSKRKKLSSNLAVIFNKEKVKSIFEKLNLDENTRAEDVNIETWRKLAEVLLIKQNGG